MPLNANILDKNYLN